MYWLFVLGNFIISIFPRRICYILAKFFATLRWLYSSKDRQALDYNLAPVIDDPELRRKYVKEVFINFSYYLVDFFRYPKLNHKFIKKYVRISGLENVQWVYSQDLPAIALSAHLGNYELAGAVTSLLKYPVAAVALPHKSKRVNNFFDSRRRMFGMEVIPSEGSMKGCLSALKKRRMLALLGDKDFSGSGLKVKMFSRYAYMPRGAAFFALRTNACIIPAFMVREDKFFYHFIFEEPIACGKDGLVSEEAILNRYIKVLEKYIKKYPGQWYMFDKYWLPEEGKRKEERAESEESSK